MAKPQLAWLQVMPAAAPKASDVSAMSTRRPAVGSISVTAVPSLMASIMSAVINGIIIWQITSPSTSNGVAIVTFM